MFEGIGYTIQRHNPNAPSRDYFSEQKRLTEFERGNRIIFDVGAHEGEAARVYYSHLPEATTYTFEPSTEGSGVNEQRFQGNRHIHPVQAAVSDTCGTRTFFVHRFNANNSLLKASRDLDDFVPGGLFDEQHECEVKTVTIDSVYKANGIENVSILKMDIQGGELLGPSARRAWKNRMTSQQGNVF